MPLIKDGRFVADDWRRLEGEALPPAGAARVVASWERFLDDAGGAQGVEAPNAVEAEALAPFFGRLKLIAIAFPGFADGRGFTLAVRLRRLGFRGELRAVGGLIPDQYAYALACGFDTVEISEAQAARQPERQWREAAKSISASYQQGYGGAPGIFAARREAAAE
jgi:uncharacterized protein (DUF934 family)